MSGHQPKNGYLPERRLADGHALRVLEVTANIDDLGGELLPGLLLDTPADSTRDTSDIEITR